MRLRCCNNVIYAHSFTIAAVPRAERFVYMQLSRNGFLETNTAPAAAAATARWKIIAIIL
jgi:hypothetical protein